MTVVPFEADQERLTELVLNLDGFEGPIDLLLTLARDQKVDLTRISILALAEQFLAFVTRARSLRLELAADYLVMAAWLAYLKSRFLIPKPELKEDEPSGEEMAAALQFHLRRLEAMQDFGQKLMERPRLGRDVFASGAAERPTVETRAIYDLSLFDLLRAYGDHRTRGQVTSFEVEPLDLYSVDEALKRLEALLGTLPDWTELTRFLPAELREPLKRRSALAATFIAALELARQGRIDLRQDGGTYAPIVIRRLEEAGQ